MAMGMIRAAGAVVWRGDEDDPEVALVHRPAYGDWSLPKGKLKRGEHVIAGALREVREETGLEVVLGRALPPVHYMHGDRLKRVDYWLAHALDDRVAADGDEVDEVVWLPIEEAQRRLTHRWDRGLLRAAGAAPLPTTPLILVRHALAGSRQEWKGDDDLRPLDERGRAQAEVLATVLGATVRPCWSARTAGAARRRSCRTPSGTGWRCGRRRRCRRADTTPARRNG